MTVDVDEIASFAESVGTPLEPWQREVVPSIYAVPPDEFRRRVRDALDLLALAARRMVPSLAALAEAWRAMAVALRPYAEAAERRRKRLRRMRHQYRLRRKGKW